MFFHTRNIFKFHFKPENVKKSSSSTFPLKISSSISSDVQFRSQLEAIISSEFVIVSPRPVPLTNYKPPASLTYVHRIEILSGEQHNNIQKSNTPRWITKHSHTRDFLIIQRTTLNYRHRLPVQNTQINQVYKRTLSNTVSVRSLSKKDNDSSLVLHFNPIPLNNFKSLRLAIPQLLRTSSLHSPAIILRRQNTPIWLVVRIHFHSLFIVPSLCLISSHRHRNRVTTQSVSQLKE